MNEFGRLSIKGLRRRELFLGGVTRNSLLLLVNMAYVAFGPVSERDAAMADLARLTCERINMFHKPTRKKARRRSY